MRVARGSAAALLCSVPDVKLEGHLANPDCGDNNLFSIAYMKRFLSTSDFNIQEIRNRIALIDNSYAATATTYRHIVAMAIIPVALKVVRQPNGIEQITELHQLLAREAKSGSLQMQQRLIRSHIWEELDAVLYKARRLPPT